MSGSTPTPITNDTTSLTPRTSFDVPSVSFDFPGVTVGVAEYSEGPTGCTVILFPRRASVEMDVRGGAPGYLGDYGVADGLCLAGGSIYGLEAIAGANAELFAQRGYSARWDRLTLIQGGIIYDYGRRDNVIYPDKALGRAAVRAARAGVIPIGSVGAGASATVGNGPRFDQGEPGGQGAAFRQFGPTKLLVFTVVNAVGAVVDREGKVVRGHLDRASGQRLLPAENLEHVLARREAREGVRQSNGNGPSLPGRNTTLTVIVTNQRFSRHDLTQWGRQVHSSMARAIQPFHTLQDGDILYAVSTGEIENRRLDAAGLGIIASELVWDAVLAAVSQPTRSERT